MDKNEGQRRVDSRDGYAPFVVRSAFRRDPEPTYPWRVVAAIMVLVVIGCCLGIAVAVSQP
jgi:hypothetical protein